MAWVGTPRTILTLSQVHFPRFLFICHTTSSRLTHLIFAFFITPTYLEDSESCLPKSAKRETNCMQFMFNPCPSMLVQISKRWNVRTILRHCKILGLWVPSDCGWTRPQTLWGFSPLLAKIANLEIPRPTPPASLITIFLLLVLYQKKWFW